jgi:putative ABC transport system substrate-binding protein
MVAMGTEGGGLALDPRHALGPMKRRLFLGIGAVLSSRAQAQTKRLPLVGSVNAGSYAPNTPFVEAFYRGMADRGYVEGKTVEYEHLWADQQFDRLPEMAAQMVNRKAALIVTTSVPAATRAVMNATRDIPILFALSSDPVEAGLVASLARPGGNVTGVTNLNAALYPKWLELLSELEPKSPKVGILTNPNAPLPSKAREELQSAARAKQVELVVLQASNEQEIAEALAVAAGPPAIPLLFSTDQLFQRQRPQIIELAKRYRVPTMGAPRAGGLMGYSADGLAIYREFGTLAAKVLGGARPADFPVLQPTKFDLILNMAAAKALGVSFPPAMQAAATEFID